MKKRNKVEFENPISVGFQTFKKVFGFLLIVASLSIGYSLLSFTVEIVEQGFNSSHLEIVNNYLPKDREFRTLNIDIPGPNSESSIGSKIVLPESLFMMFFLTIGVIVISIILRFVIAIFQGGISLFKEDITYVIETLRRELKYAEKKGRLGSASNSSSAVKKDFKL